MRGPVYLDYNATAKVRAEAIEAMSRVMTSAGNPSSVHAAGRAARTSMEEARACVAALVHGLPELVTFTSGGTEANNLAIMSAVANGAERVIVGATEHDSVRAGAEATGASVSVWPVDARGLADLDWLSEELARGDRLLVCLMLANNETGVLQPVLDVSLMTREFGGWVHVDAVQAAGKVDVDYLALGVDSLAISAHKLGGPQGVGALVGGHDLIRQQHGGAQESGRRGGTQNGPGIAGFGAAASAAGTDLPAMEGQAEWRDELAARLVERGATVLGAGAERLPQTLCIATPGFPSDLQVMALDLAGVMISAGAACSSGRVKASAVVEVMGRTDLASCSIRVSGGWASTAEDWRRCGDAWVEAFERWSTRQKRAA